MMLANAAFITAAVSLVIRAVTQMLVVIQKRMEPKEKERIGLVQFYTDVWLRARDLADVPNGPSLENGGEKVGC